MFRALIFCTVLLPYSTSAAPHKSAAVPFAPELKGFGSFTFGGSGRNLGKAESDVIAVTSLTDSGNGSLRACVERRGPRTCVFEVGGIIQLRSALTVSNPYLTIAGQTAPHPGVFLTGAGLLIEAPNVVVQHIAIRVGDAREGPNPEERDGLRIGAEGKDVYNVVADHLSVAWAIDENVSVVSRAHDITISSSLIYEGLDRSIHPKGAHSKGMLIAPNCKNVTVIGNVIAFHGERNPLIQPGSSVQFVNNVVYGWGQKSYSSLLDLSDSGGLGKGVELDFVGNLYLHAPWATSFAPIFAKPASPETRIFVKDNSAPTRLEANASEWAVVSLPEIPHRVYKPIFTSSLEIAHPITDILLEVSRNAGSRPKKRNAVDQRIITEIQTQRGGIKDCIKGCKRAVGGWPKVRAAKKPLNVPKQNRQDFDSNGYLSLDEWLHQRAMRVQ